MGSRHPHIAYVMPTGGQTPGHLDYSRRCLESLYRGTYPARLYVIVIDDASPDWEEGRWLLDLPQNPHPEVVSMAAMRFDEPGGLTRSWNAGYAAAKELKPDIIVIGNDDVLLPSMWWRGLAAALENYDFVGPLSNAPGATIGNQQDVRKWLADYKLSDHQGAIDTIGATLYSRYGGRVQPSPVNGFMVAGTLASWDKYAYDDRNVLPARIEIMPSGRRNPTPLMTGQEDWLHQHVTAAGGTMGASVGSFCFHYRSLSRGLAYARRGGLWYRRKEKR